MLGELEQSLVEVFDALMYRDRIELGSVNAYFDGLIRRTPTSDSNLLLVDDLLIQLEDLTFTGDFFRLLESDFEIPLPMATASIARLDLQLDSGILFPDTDNSDDIPDIECQAGEVVGGLPERVAGLASVACVTGSFDGSSGRIELTAGNLRGHVFDKLIFSAEDATLIIDPDGTTDPLLQIATANLNLPLPGSAIDLQIEDLQISHSREVSIRSAIATTDLEALHAFALRSFLPVYVHTVRIDPVDPSDPASRVILNRDTQFDIRVLGEFNNRIFETLGLRADITIGSGAANEFDATFRVVPEGDTHEVRPWQTGPIRLGLEAGAEDTKVGLAFDAELVLGGYVDGNWQADLSGTIDSAASLITDDSTRRSNLTLELRPGSFLEAGNLTLNTQIQFDTQDTGQYLGMELSGLTLGFQMTLDWGFTNQAPHVYFTDFSVAPGQVSVAQMVIDITNVVTLTVNEVLLVPNAGPNEPFATINSIDVDFANNSLLAGLGIETFTITDSGVYADRLRLGNVEVVLDGTLHRSKRICWSWKSFFSRSQALKLVAYSIATV